MTRVRGKSSNRLCRLDTDQGSFAVKELNLVGRRWTYHADDVFRFEQAAFAAGIPMPQPISADPGVLVHRWVEGDKLPEAPVPAAFAFEVGEILARIHALDVHWARVPVEDPTPRDWPELAEQAAATGQPLVRRARHRQVPCRHCPVSRRAPERLHPAVPQRICGSAGEQGKHGY
jgi:hypothetical protein